ncbi:hypothetical protein, partial [Salmonella enterica]|uniref:hypothetical protein n=1 Tax=Salmonella enterica TaxID=28901 RepID=UPI0039E7FFE1
SAYKNHSNGASKKIVHKRSTPKLPSSPPNEQSRTRYLNEINNTTKKQQKTHIYEMFSGHFMTETQPLG